MKCFLIICFVLISNISHACNIEIKHFEAKYNIPKNILKTISTIESSKYPWTINVGGKGYMFNEKEKAINYTKMAVEKYGKTNIDIGCMQLNVKWHAHNFSSIKEMFEPSKNVEYAAKLLKSHFAQTKNWKEAVKRYHSLDQKHKEVYFAKFVAEYTR